MSMCVFANRDAWRRGAKPAGFRSAGRVSGRSAALHVRLCSWAGVRGKCTKRASEGCRKRGFAFLTRPKGGKRNNQSRYSEEKIRSGVWGQIAEAVGSVLSPGSLESYRLRGALGSREAAVGPGRGTGLWSWKRTCLCSLSSCFLEYFDFPI